MALVYQFECFRLLFRNTQRHLGINNWDTWCSFKSLVHFMGLTNLTSGLNETWGLPTRFQTLCFVRGRFLPLNIASMWCTRVGPSLVLSEPNYRAQGGFHVTELQTVKYNNTSRNYSLRIASHTYQQFDQALTPHPAQACELPLEIDKPLMRCQIHMMWLHSNVGQCADCLVCFIYQRSDQKLTSYPSVKTVAWNRQPVNMLSRLHQQESDKVLCTFLCAGPRHVHVCSRCEWRRCRDDLAYRK